MSTQQKTGRSDIRRLEEEGLYTGPEPDVPTRNVNTIEQRLLKQPDRVIRASSDFLVYCNFVFFFLILRVLDGLVLMEKLSNYQPH